MDLQTEKLADLEISKSSGAQGSLREKFGKITEMSGNEQAEFFLKSFVFDLGDDWKQVIVLTKKFQSYLDEKVEKHDLDAGQAADFLQKQGRTRTAMQRRAELKDIDLDMNDRICLIEYLILHFKILILSAYFKRHKMEPNVSMENDGVGLVGVGEMLLEEVMHMPEGLDPELVKAIEEFMAKKEAKDKTMKALSEKVKLGGVKGLTAKNELMQLENADPTEDNRIEITLNAAKRRQGKDSGAVALEKKKKAEEEAKKAAVKESRSKLAAKAAMFNN